MRPGHPPLETMAHVTVSEAPRRTPVRTHRARRALSVVAVLVVAVPLGVVSLAGMSALLGYKAMVVTSGSMEPGISAGDAVVITSADPERLASGDVIAFTPLRGHGTTTHRIIGSSTVDGRLHFRTQGDANETPDANLVPAGNVIGRLVVRLPRTGSLLAFVGGPAGRALLVGIPALLLAAGQIRSLWRPAGEG